MRQPPKRELADGSISEYRGRPTLVDVTRTVEIMREEQIQDRSRLEAEKILAEQESLRQRKAKGEEFFTLADVLRATNVRLEDAAKGMPEEGGTINSDAKLERQKAELLNRTNS